MDKIKGQLAGVAALLGVIAAIGGGFVKYGEIITKLDALESQEHSTVDTSSIESSIAVLEEKVSKLENVDTSHTHEQEEHSHTVSLVNKKEIELLKVQIEEIKVSTKTHYQTKMQLSKHFTLKEMTKSMTATRKGIDNTPGSGEIKSLGDLCYEILEPLRAHFDKPVTITSGYRSEALCEAIGSKKTSQHAKGQAVDLEIFGVPNIKTAYWLQNNVDFDQLIMEFFDKDDPAGGWVHISYHESGSNRKQVLTFDGKKYSEGLPDMEWKGGRVVG